MTGILYLVATPIGNLEDMTFRGLKVLELADLIGAEDTRHTGKLLHHFQVKTPMVSYHLHNYQSRIAEFIPRLREGENIALVTDAGTPAISDPGYNLVRACVEGNIQVIPIPGANAAINGLIASGLSTERFVFEGFLATKKKLRDALLSELKDERRTIIFYESPHRLRKTLGDFLRVFGASRQITLARELTKLHEDFWRGTVEGAIALYQEKEPRGEYTIIVAGNSDQQWEQLSHEEIKKRLSALVQEGMSKSEASQQLAKLTNLSRREIYRLSIDMDD
ncbi:16S rRNA (cytidine(1402)-2'-O)-methyltransferase [Cyanobacterium sp. IPPAS B-1200]|uniref:16S rRNA (cytidine(1402)-2'-O)-methyltransferase n=1 Tax=Cyanobacterium sp. IPPAS B-1200 TaxID=1562720 RepID=UPI0008527D8E|nr:16S rRNA (cytidine(1402)-2'-O)-methyltransferase [Cyanobacterium sp. IPPAS B-1200]OEJ79201.1 rRNA (cytidine-2'-O-)-methyltransferase [Cyanobacterium sp. IPPAS B-1200]